MSELIAWMGAVVPTFMLVLSRTLGLMIQAPLLSNKNVPAPARMAIAVALSIVTMTLLPSYPAIPNMLLAFLLMALTELVLGALFGFASSFLFYAIQSAGELAGVQAGMSFASTMNPFLRTNVNPFGTLYFNVALVLFVLIGGHLWLIGGFLQSFRLVPIGAFIMTPAIGEHFIQLSGSFLAITLQLALPAVIVLFLTDLGVGYISKVAPQASNILELVQAIKPLAGLLILLLMLPNLMTVSHTLAEQMIADLDKFLHIAGQRRP